MPFPPQKSKGGGGGAQVFRVAADAADAAGLSCPPPQAQPAAPLPL